MQSTCSQVEPKFYQSKVNNRIVTEGSAASYFCNATIPVSSYLEWKNLDNKTVPIIKLVTPLTLYDTYDLCQASTHSWDAISLFIRNSTVHNPEGL